MISQNEVSEKQMPFGRRGIKHDCDVLLGE